MPGSECTISSKSPEYVATDICSSIGALCLLNTVTVTVLLSIAFVCKYYNAEFVAQRIVEQFYPAKQKTDGLWEKCKKVDFYFKCLSLPPLSNVSPFPILSIINTI